MMTIEQFRSALRAGMPLTFASNFRTLDFAEELDAQDKLRHLQDEFVLPTRGMMRREQLSGSSDEESEPEPPFPFFNESIEKIQEGEIKRYPSCIKSSKHAVYFCGNSLGLQPKAVRRYVDAQLETWGSIGVNGHFRTLGESPLVAWQDMAATCSVQMAKLVGAAPAEVVTMNSLTANLHLMMASFYQPTATRHKIIAEWKPFPSDTYAIESQIKWHGFNPATSLVELQPDENMFISTEAVMAAIDEHAADAALLLLPGIQYYSGQLFNMAPITAYARSKGIVVGWDLAHAVGNVELKLHDWDVDFAVWCTYKYLNAGPGSIAGAFVHERHGYVQSDLKPESPRQGPNPDFVDDGGDTTEDDPRDITFNYRPRLSGWYGGDIRARFDMAKTFWPTSGAQGFQLSNPSAIDLASLSASLSVFAKTDMETLRDKSMVMTAYAEALLNEILKDAKQAHDDKDAEKAKDAKHDENTKDTTSSKDSKDSKDTKEAKAAKAFKEAKAAKDARYDEDNKDSTDSKDSEDAKDVKDSDDAKDAKDATAFKDAKDAKDAEAGKKVDDYVPPFHIITPSNPADRGAQLSVLLKDKITMSKVTRAMEVQCVIMDKRKPNVIRIAPVPLYNTFVEVYVVASVLRKALLGSS